MAQKKYIWLGVRESDIADTNGLFAGSITLFGSGTGGNRSMERRQHRRVDHNGECPGYQDFFQAAMRSILADMPEAQFFQYASLDGVGFSPELRERFVFQNDDALSAFLEHKIKLKQWAEQYVPVLPYHVLPGRMCVWKDLRERFPDHQAVVIQKDSSCGGFGTFRAQLEPDRFPQLPLSEDELCMVTAFQPNSISVNLHAILYQDQTMLFPPSVQIIDQDHECLQYLGADFSVYRTLPPGEQDLVRTSAAVICAELRKLGYRGVCGIDLLLSDGCCYFMEVNPRFQASTAALNRYLLSRGLPSLQEYHIDAFSYSLPTLPEPPVFADSSFFTYHYDQKQDDRLRWLWSTLKDTEGFSLCDDCLSWEDALDDGCYIFQLQYAHTISSITHQHTLQLHPNVSLSPFIIDGSREPSNLIRLKLLLLSRGLSITPAAWQLAQRTGGADWEEFCAVTIRLFQELWITAPCMERWHALSPMQLDVLPEKDVFVLRYYGKVLTIPIEVMPEDPCGHIKTRKGHFLKDIVYMNPDRLRVYHRNGCALQDAGIGCKFCDLYGVEDDFDFDEICEALSYYWENPRVEHYLIGGGSELPGDGCETILRLARYLHEHSGKHIYLMSQPIQDPDTLRLLQKCGVTEVAFNIEMFDRELARLIMPGKARNTLQDYLTSLRNAVGIWGSAGSVRSVLLLGFDDLEGFARGIRELCQSGVTPILSLFRPCPGTPLEHYMPLDEASALLYYETADRICKSFQMKLGPSCKACQNNTVALDI